MSNISKIETVDRPAEIALMNAITKAIDDIAVGKMTLAEILGVLDLAGKELFERLE